MDKETATEHLRKVFQMNPQTCVDCPKCGHVLFYLYRSEALYCPDCKESTALVTTKGKDNDG